MLEQQALRSNGLMMQAYRSMVLEQGTAVGVALAAGNYRVIATNTTSLCSSTVATFTVDDVSVTPVITQNTIINNTNCTGAPSNGSITIDVDGGAPAYRLYDPVVYGNRNIKSDSGSNDSDLI